MPSTTVLLILDGFGYSAEEKYNAIAKAHTPQWDNWMQHCPSLLLDASGTSVGLPQQQMGNSEVGHMHIGAGRVIEQDLSRIRNAIASEDFFHNPVLLDLLQYTQQKKSALHIIGLLSKGGVHSHEDHLFTFLALCQQQNIPNIFLHLFLDGRDTAPKVALESLAKLTEILQHYPKAKLASLAGRYYAMDRDKRWDRLLPVYTLLTEGKSPYVFSSAEEAVTYFYQQGIQDEFLPPTRIGDIHPIKDEDAIFFFNFRADRARQLTQALIDPDFTGFIRNTIPTLGTMVTMTRYAEHLATKAVFPPLNMQHTLGEVLAHVGLSQLRIAETEKYAHVTFFFNGGKEEASTKEERILVPSSSVATYDLCPEMSAPAITKTLVDAILTHRYDVIIANFANADMVGHTGNFAATVTAIECLDNCLSLIGEALKQAGGHMLITADHGNAEAMFNETTQEVHKAHTNQPVPFLYVGKEGWQVTRKHGTLIDIAPTLLTLLGLAIPKEMTGTSLLEKRHAPTN